jgi:hypothetical protein
MAGTQHTVERARGDRQLCARLDLENLADECVDDGVADARKIETAIDCGLLAAEIALELDPA